MARIGSARQLVPHASLDELISAQPRDESLASLKSEPLSGFIKLKALALDIYLQQVIRESANDSAGGLIQRACVGPTGVTYNRVFRLDDRALNFLHGFDEERWKVVDHDKRKVFELLGCLEAERLAPNKLDELLIDV